MDRGFRSQSWLTKSYLKIFFMRGTPFGISADSIDADLPFPIHFCVPEDDVYTLQSVIKELTAFNKHLKELVLDKETGKLKGSTMLVLNGTHTDLLAGMDTLVKSGDQLLLTPYLAGG
jgi:molybdopterin converting factor small subunit